MSEPSTASNGGTKEKSPRPSKHSNKVRGALLTALGAVMLGALGSGLWDILAKPGLSRLGRFFLGLITLGSERVRDAAYTSAALDPSPLPPLLLLIVVSIIPLIAAFMMGFMEFGMSPIIRWLDKPSTNPALGDDKNHTEKGEESRTWREAQKIRRFKIRRRLSIFFIIYCCIFFLIIFVGVSIVNQAIVIKRVFDANIRICAPYLSDKEEKRLRARFAAMNSRIDYIAINNDLKQVASQNGISLINVQPW
jgi:hypothetical protein